MSEEDKEPQIVALSARVEQLDAVASIVPRLQVKSARDAVLVVSVEIDNLELRPSAKVAVAAGETVVEVPAVRIVNPTGSYELKVRVHRADRIEDLRCPVEFGNGTAEHGFECQS